MVKFLAHLTLVIKCPERHPLVLCEVKKALSFYFNTFNLCPNFSPEDLLAHKKKPSQLPLQGGPKAFAPDVDADDKILSSLLQEHGDVLQEQRVAKKYILLSSFLCSLTTPRVTNYLL